MMYLRVFLNILIGLLFCSKLWANPNYFEFNQNNNQQVRLPHQYELNKKRYHERGQIIPATANQSTSPGAFAGQVLRYHFSNVLENKDWLGLKEAKRLQNKISQKTSFETSHFKITPKFNAHRMNAVIDIQTYLHTKIWTENTFRTIRSQLEISRSENQLISIEHISNRQDTRTYFNLERTW